MSNTTVPVSELMHGELAVIEGVLVFVDRIVTFDSGEQPLTTIFTGSTSLTYAADAVATLAGF